MGNANCCFSDNTNQNELFTSECTEYVNISINNKEIPIPGKIFSIYSKDSIKPLGKGGFGIVFQIERIADKKILAIKRTIFEDPSEYSQCIEEMNALHCLFPFGNIVQFIENYQDQKNKAIFIVMEKGDMCLTDFLIENKKTLNASVLKQLLIDMIFALWFTHKKSIAHSDIKPANILVFKNLKRTELKNIFQSQEFNQIVFKLTDFGAGTKKFTQNLTKFRDNMGFTKSYAAPEIILASEEREEKDLNECKIKVIFEKADIYSLGITLLECCNIDVNIGSVKKLNILPNQETHDNQLNKFLNELKKKQDYSWFCPILFGMLQYDVGKRFSLKLIFESLEMQLPHEKDMPDIRPNQQKNLIGNRYPPEDIAIEINYDFSQSIKNLNEKSKFLRRKLVENEMLHNIVIKEKKPSLWFSNQTPGGQRVTRKYIETEEIYNGFYSEGLKDCSGHQLNKNGSVYRGLFRRGLYCGNGIMVYGDGKIIDGIWENGMITFGVLLESNGDMYVGDFKADLKHGLGVEFIKDESAYAGEFAQGLKHGKGFLKEKDADLRKVEYEMNILKKREKNDGKAEIENFVYFKIEIKKELTNTPIINNNPPIPSQTQKPDLSKGNNDFPDKYFGKEMWEKYYGKVDNSPALPKNISEILNSDCPYFKGKKVKDSHFLAYIPTTVNNKKLSLAYFGELIQKPITGPKTQFYAEFKSYDASLNTEEIKKSYWVLMTKYEVPGTRAKKKDESYYMDFDTQITFLKDGYSAPRAIEVAVCTIMHFVETKGEKEWYFGDGEYINSEKSYTYCEDTVEKAMKGIFMQKFVNGKLVVIDKFHLFVGGFGDKGLAIENSESYSIGGCLGLGAAKRF